MNTDKRIVLSVRIRVHPWPKNSIEPFLDRRWLHLPRHLPNHPARYNSLAALVPLNASFYRHIKKQRLDLTPIPARQLDIRPTLPARQMRRVNIRHRTPRLQTLPDQVSDGREHSGMDGLIFRIIGDQAPDFIGRNRVPTAALQISRFAGSRQANRDDDLHYTA